MIFRAYILDIYKYLYTKIIYHDINIITLLILLIYFMLSLSIKYIVSF